MLTRNRINSLVFSLIMGTLTHCVYAGYAADSLILYTPFTKISVQPGESVDYSIDVINNSQDLKTLDLSVRGIPGSWTYELKSGAWNVKQIAVLPGEKRSLTLKVDVPYQVNKGSYRFELAAGISVSLPLVIVVSQQGTLKSELSSRQTNMKGHAGSTYTFNADLKNRTGDTQQYALMAEAPRGWEVSFKVFGKQVTSVEVEPNNTQNIAIDVNPSDQVEAGNYLIPVRATTGTGSAELNLEVVITGTYKMMLTTKTGLLSTDIVAGEEKKVELIIKNTGTSALSEVGLSSSAPVNWQVTFDPKEVKTILSGKEATVTATIVADKKAIPGDYIATLEARTPEVSSSASFRISVRTPLLWGWTGILVIAAAIGSVYYLFRKYGRR